MDYCSINVHLLQLHPSKLKGLYFSSISQSLIKSVRIPSWGTELQGWPHKGRLYCWYITIALHCSSEKAQNLVGFRCNLHHVAWSSICTRKVLVYIYEKSSYLTLFFMFTLAPPSSSRLTILVYPLALEYMRGVLPSCNIYK